MNIEYLEALVVYLGALILIATPIVFVLEKGAKRWLAHALTTPSPHDDRAASAAVRACAAFLAAVAFLPRVSTGLAEARRIRDAVQAIPRPRVPPALLVFMLVLPMALSAACAGTHIDQTRTILLATDGYVDRVDEGVGPLLEAAHERAEAEATDRADYERRMRPWNAVRAAITGVQVSLVSAATTVNAVEAGQDRDIGGSIACVVEALTQLTELLPLVNVDIPPLLQTGIALLQGISSGLCPSPPAETEEAPEPASDSGEGTS